MSQFWDCLKLKSHCTTNWVHAGSSTKMGHDSMLMFLHDFGGLRNIFEKVVLSMKAADAVTWHQGPVVAPWCSWNLLLHAFLSWVVTREEEKAKRNEFQDMLVFPFSFSRLEVWRPKAKEKRGICRNDVQTFAFACWLLKWFLLSQWSPKTLFIFTHDCLPTWLLCKVWTVSKQKHCKSHCRSSTKRSLVKQGKAVLTDVSFDHEILQSLHLAPMTTFDIQIVHRISNKTQKTEHFDNHNIGRVHSFDVQQLLQLNLTFCSSPNLSQMLEQISNMLLLVVELFVRLSCQFA